MPMKYFNQNAEEPAAWAGRNLQYASGLGIRPAIGGKRSKRQKHQKQSKGGFYPSVMGSFTDLAGRFITPVALYAGYKLITNRTHGQRSKRSKRNKRSTKRR
jgi:hypothetical protein